MYDLATLRLGSFMLFIGLLGSCKPASRGSLPDPIRSSTSTSTSNISSVDTTAQMTSTSATSGAPYNTCQTHGGQGSWCNYRCGSAGLWCSYDAANKQQPCVIPDGVTGPTCANDGNSDVMPASADTTSSTTDTATTNTTASTPSTTPNILDIIFHPTPSIPGACSDCSNCGAYCCRNPGAYFACNNGWWCAYDNFGIGPACLVKQMDTATINAQNADATAAANAAAASGGYAAGYTASGSTCASCFNCGEKCCHNPGPWYACNGWWCANDNNGAGPACVVRQQ